MSYYLKENTFCYLNLMETTGLVVNLEIMIWGICVRFTSGVLRRLKNAQLAVLRFKRYPRV